MEILRYLPIFNKCASPEIMNGEFEARAQAITQLSSGSSATTCGFSVIGKILQILRIPVVISPIVVPHSVMGFLNLGLPRTSISSFSRNSLRQRVSFFSSMSFKILFDGPGQRSAEISTFVSKTTFINRFFFLCGGDALLWRSPSGKGLSLFYGKPGKRDEKNSFFLS